MLYLDYSAREGEWIPNEYGGQREPRGDRVPPGAQRRRPRRAPGRADDRRGVDRLAGRVTRPVDVGGLGFTHKWNMGWMHDTLEYFAKDPLLPPLPPPPADLRARSTPGARTSSCRSATTRSSTARARCSARCPATPGSSFANLRALYGWMWAHPGKKLLFMGGELGQEREWSHDRSPRLAPPRGRPAPRPARPRRRAEPAGPRPGGAVAG